jgi:hypothetical protein
VPVYTATLDFDEGDAEIVLQLACHDFGRITGGTPIEAQIYEAWVAAIALARVSDKRCFAARSSSGASWPTSLASAALPTEQSRKKLALGC